MTKLRVLIVDDHQIVREGVRAVLNTDESLEVVAEAENGLQACEEAARCRPDVIVMDVSMPDLNGRDATRRIRAIVPDTKIVALTVHDQPVYVRELLRSGASGYVLKRAVVRDLLRAIHAVAAGGVFLDPELASSADAENPADPGWLNAELSSRETEVAELSARGHSNAEIAATLSIGIKTVETHKGKVMTKLGLKTRAQLVRYAIYRGWLSR